MHKLSLFFGLTGAAVVTLAVSLGFILFPSLVDNKIKNELRLVRGSNVWNRWVHIDTPIYLNIYIFNVTNPDEVEAGGTPNLQQAGPYAYRQRREKIDPVVENCKETVKYEQKVTYFFDPEKSGSNTEEDLVNVVNVPFISVVSIVAKEVESLLPILADELAAESLIRRNVPVGELLFKGFDVSGFNNTIISESLPASFSGYRFGLYKERNGSTNGLFEVFTGASKHKKDKFGTIKSWNGNTHLDYWNGTACNKITGTDGSLFRPFLEKKDSLQFFSTELCRVFELTFKEEVSSRNIDGLRFALAKEVFQAPDKNPENACYCLRDADKCHDGIIDLSPCRKGAPILLSAPHFLDGDEGYVNGMQGLAPNRKLHETFIDVEPRTGLLLEAHRRIQINVELTKIEDIPQLDFIEGEVPFPVFWMDEEASMCDVDAEDLKQRVDTPVRTVSIIGWAAVAIGIVLILLAFAAPYACPRTSRSFKFEKS